MKAKNRNNALLVLFALVALGGAFTLARTGEDVPLPDSPYPVRTAMTTFFWVGEAAGAENAGIPNHESFWDDEWQGHFGGVDDPTLRCGYAPCGFQPKENPFYVALPYGEYEDGALKENAKNVPWYAEVAPEEPLLKNRWVEVRYSGRTCYGQWEDVGPNGEDDFAYVFGGIKTPANTFGERAGLDVSPALWACLSMTDNARTEWRFVPEGNVPEGPWKETTTTRGVSWQ
ncbi:MAG: hypothetical protein AAB923_02180 [Patescibacteria group bacterium]|mgnify:CR=1 FL=1